ncbi:hypothetical protein ACRRTK_016215 [Alexandromys fortis]
MFLEDGLNLSREDQHGRRVIKMSRFIKSLSSYTCYMLTTSRNYTLPASSHRALPGSTCCDFLCFVMKLKKPKLSIFMGLEEARKEYF